MIAEKGVAISKLLALSFFWAEKVGFKRTGLTEQDRASSYKASFPDLEYLATTR